MLIMGFIIFIAWIALSILVGVLATNKGRKFLGWFLLSALISPLFGILALLVAGETEEQWEDRIKRDEEIRIEVSSKPLAKVSENNKDQ